MASSRLEIHERFRTNLESIINKYDKPFEDSPILDIHNADEHCVTDGVQEIDYFKAFGRTPLATDLQKGKKRKGGVSTDSALGSTLSLCNNMSEESSGNIHLQSYDFTHEESDALGGFIRYKHHSVMKKPQIAGLRKDGDDFDEDIDSDDHLGSMCSGPVSVPYRERAKDTDSLEDDDGDMSDSGRTSQTDSIYESDTIAGPDLDIKSPQDKVRSWLSDDAFMSRHSNMDMDDDFEGDESLVELEDISQDEYPSTLSDDRPESPAMSLLEIKERFVRRVQSILVEENNETDDITSSADEDGDFPQPGIVGRTEAGWNGTHGEDIVKTVSSREPLSSTLCEEPAIDRRGRNHDDWKEELSERKNTSKSIKIKAASSRRLFKRPLSSTLCEEPSFDRGGRNQGFHGNKALMLREGETTILAGHCDDIIASPESSREAGTKDASDQKGFELIHSPSGKVEWGSYLGKSSSVKQSIGSKGECSSPPDSSVTPKKPMLYSGSTEQTFKTPQSKSNFKFKSPRTPSNTVDQAQGIMNEIMDFFKSPLPQILTSPMPMLSPKGRLRTAQGKPVVRGAAAKGDELGRMCSPAPASRESSLLKSKQLQSIMAMKQSMPQGRTVNAQETLPSHISVHERAVTDKTPSKCQSKDNSNTDQKLLEVQKRRSIEECVSTEEEVDISLLTEESDASPSRHQSPSRHTGPSHSGKKLCKIPRTPTTSNIAANEPESLSKTPGISSPFSHMRVDSTRKGHLDARRETGEKEMRASCPPKSLMFEGTDRRDSMDDDRLDTGALVMMSSDDDDEMECSMKENTNKSRVGTNSIKSFASEQTSRDSPLRFAMKDKLKKNSGERQSSEHSRKDAAKLSFDHVEELSECGQETKRSFDTQNRGAGFEQTYIIADQGKRTTAPHHMSPASKCKVREQQHCRTDEQTSVRQPVQGKLKQAKKHERRADQSKEKFLESDVIRSNPSADSCAPKDVTRPAQKISYKASSAIKDQRHHHVKKYSKHSAAHQDERCSLEKLSRGNDETSIAKDNTFKRQEYSRASHQRESSLQNNLDYRGRNLDRFSNESEDSGSASSELSSSDDLEQCRTYTNPRKLSVPSVDRNTNSIKTKYQRQTVSPSQMEDSSGRSSTRHKPSSYHRMVQDDWPRAKTAAIVCLKKMPFLSSTRIDEDERDGMNEDLHISTSNSLQRREQRREVKPKRSQRTQGDAYKEESMEKKTEIPTKRRRQGSDRANSLESPAKRPVKASRSSRTSQSWDKNSQPMIISGQTKDNTSQPSVNNSQNEDRNSQPMGVNSQLTLKNGQLNDQKSQPLVRNSQKKDRKSPKKDRNSQPREMSSLLQDKKSQSPARRSQQKDIRKQSQDRSSQRRKKTSQPMHSSRYTQDRNTSSGDNSSQPGDSISSQSWDIDSQTSEMGNISRDSTSKVQGNRSQLSPTRSRKFKKSRDSFELSDSSDDESNVMLSLSSICEGPGKCVKKICFKCAMR